MTKIKKENKAFWLRFVKNLLKRFLYGSLLQEDGWLVTKVRGKGEVQVVGEKSAKLPREVPVSAVLIPVRVWHRSVIKRFITE